MKHTYFFLLMCALCGALGIHAQTPLPEYPEFMGGGREIQDEDPPFFFSLPAQDRALIEKNLVPLPLPKVDNLEERRKMRAFERANGYRNNEYHVTKFRQDFKKLAYHYTSGDKEVWMLKIHSPGAKGMRIFFGNCHLSPGSRIHFISSSFSKYVIYDHTRAVAPKYSLSGGFDKEDVLYIELVEPKGKPGNLILYSLWHRFYIPGVDDDDLDPDTTGRLPQYRLDEESYLPPRFKLSCSDQLACYV